MSPSVLRDLFATVQGFCLHVGDDLLVWRVRNAQLEKMKSVFRFRSALRQYFQDHKIVVHFSGLRAAITRPWARQDAIAMNRPAVGHGPAVARTLERASAFRGGVQLALRVGIACEVGVCVTCPRRGDCARPMDRVRLRLTSWPVNDVISCNFV